MPLRVRPRALRLIGVAALALSAVGAMAFVGSEALKGDEGAPPQNNQMETHDDLLVRVDRLAPGFGGMFIDPDGRLAIYLLQPSQLPAAQAAIEAVFGPSIVPPAGTRALQGQYAVTQLKEWFDRAGQRLSLPGVTLLDLDEAKNRLTVGVEDGAKLREVEQALSRLGVPLEAVLIQVTGEIRPLGH